jgi:hypothetical protein
MRNGGGGHYELESLKEAAVGYFKIRVKAPKIRSMAGAFRLSQTCYRSARLSVHPD